MVATDEPLLVPLDVEEVTETYVDIVEAGAAHRIVTTIEVLSPTNKRPGEDRRNYIRKQRKMLDGLVNIVEIDLLRTGLPVTAVPQVSIPEDRRTPLHVCVRRTTTPLVAEVYPIPLRERLPIIRVPLRETDADVALDLQTLIGQCWENGGYDDIDYSAPAEPPLEGPDAAWADALLRERKLRADPPAA